MRKLTLLILFLGILLYLPASAQDPPMWQLTGKDGLSSMTVYQIIQDQKGYIWLGTAKGLCRYDGRHFTSIDLTGALDHDILQLGLDSFGRIWFNNLSGQLGWVEDLEAHFVRLEELDSLGIQLPLRFELKDSTMIIGAKTTEGEVVHMRMIIDKKEAEFRPHFLHGQELHSTDSPRNFQGQWYTWRVFHKKNKMIFTIIREDSLIQVENYTSSDLQKVAEYSIPFTLEYVSDKGDYYFGGLQQLYHYEDGKQIRPILDNFKYKINGCIEIDQQLWILTQQGIHVQDLQTHELKSIWLRNVEVNEVYKDRLGNCWIATASEGVFVMPNRNMKVYTTQNSDLPIDDIYSLHFSPQYQQLYIGLADGMLSICDVNKSTLKNQQLPKVGRLVSILERNNRQVFIGLDDGLCIYNPQTKKVHSFPTGSSMKVIQKANDALWFGASSSCSKIMEVPERSSEIASIFFRRRDRVMQKRVYALKNDLQNRMWIGTTSGIYRYENEEVSLLFEDENKDRHSVTSIIQSADSSMWIGTAGEGVLRVKNDEIIRQYTIADGLCSNNCRSLFAENGYLYFGTDNGLTILNVESNEMQQVDLRDGLPSEEIMAITGYGKLIWLATPKGFVEFDVNTIKPNTNRPNIYLSGTLLNGKDTLLQNDCKLAYWQNTLGFFYEGLALRSRGTETYQYRLLGLNEEWNANNVRQARYHNLAPGQYEFQVKTVNEDGYESAEPASLKFSIASPWWQTTWFYLISILGLMTVSGSIVYWRQKDLRKREQVETELNDKIQLLRTEALRTQMNPHFIYNALNAIQDFFITNDQEGALFYLSKFARMIRLIFDYSSRETISFEEEIEFLQLYLDLEKLRFGDRVIISLKLNEELEARMSMISIPPLLIQPVVENAFKHGLMHRLEGGKLDIRFEEQGQRIKCTVQDNGIGREKAANLEKWIHKKRNLSGLTATKERLMMWQPGDPAEERLIISDLQNADGQAVGTKVDLLI